MMADKEHVKVRDAIDELRNIVIGTMIFEEETTEDRVAALLDLIDSAYKLVEDISYNKGYHEGYDLACIREGDDGGYDRGYDEGYNKGVFIQKLRRKLRWWPYRWLHS